MFNLLNNGDFIINQRGTKFRNIAEGMISDRWYFKQSGAAQNSVAIVQNTAGPSVPGTRRYLEISGGDSASTGRMHLIQAIASNESLAVRNCPIIARFFVRTTSKTKKFDLEFTLYGGGGENKARELANWPGLAILGSASFEPTGKWRPVAISTKVPATDVTQLAVEVSWNAAGAAGHGNAIQITGFEMYLGEEISPYFRALPEPLERVQCLAYYEQLAKPPIPGAETFGSVVIGPAIMSAAVDGVQHFVCPIVFAEKRHRLYEFVFSPNTATDVHLLNLTPPDSGPPIYDLTLGYPANTGHKSYNRAYIRGCYTIDENHPPLTIGTGTVLATDETPTACIAIDCEL